MFRSINARGLVQTLVASSLVASFALTGCGSNMATAPEFVAIENDDGGYEVPIPGRIGIPMPVALRVDDLTVDGAHLSWLSPGAGYTAIVTLNGAEIGRTDAANGFFNDELSKAPGNYTWGVCFVLGSRMGREGRVSGNISAPPTAEGHGKRPDGQG